MSGAECAQCGLRGCRLTPHRVWHASSTTPIITIHAACAAPWLRPDLRLNGAGIGAIGDERMRAPQTSAMKAWQLPASLRFGSIARTVLNTSSGRHACARARLLEARIWGAMRCVGARADRLVHAAAIALGAM